jgi:hypothetical protein
MLPWVWGGYRVHGAADADGNRTSLFQWGESAVFRR